MARTARRQHKRKPAASRLSMASSEAGGIAGNALLGRLYSLHNPLASTRANYIALHQLAQRAYPAHPFRRMKAIPSLPRFLGECIYINTPFRQSRLDRPPDRPKDEREQAHHALCRCPRRGRPGLCNDSTCFGLLDGWSQRTLDAVPPVPQWIITVLPYAVPQSTPHAPPF